MQMRVWSSLQREMDHSLRSGKGAFADPVHATGHLSAASVLDLQLLHEFPHDHVFLGLNEAAGLVLEEVHYDL